MTLDEVIAHAREKAKEKRKEMQCKTCKLFVRSDLHPLQGYCRKNEFHSIEIDSWRKVCGEYVPTEICKCAEEYEQIAEWLVELKALRILLDWASECGFGLDSFPNEYVQYKHTLTDDMSYTEMVKKIAKCVVKEG